MTFEVLKDGTLNGFAGWFDTTLAANISLSTSPTALTTHWKQGFLPLRSPEKVKLGQKITLEIEIAPDVSGLNSVVGYGYSVL